MKTVRRIGMAQRFRPYTGSSPAPISEREALRLGKHPGDYSLGLADVGMVHESGTVAWTPVWIIAAENFVDDVNQVARGPRDGPPERPKPGWLRFVTMIDAGTGEFVMEFIT